MQGLMIIERSVPSKQLTPITTVALFCIVEAGLCGISVGVCICVYVYIYKYVCIYIYVYIYIYICVCIYGFQDVVLAEGRAGKHQTSHQRKDSKSASTTA